MSARRVSRRNRVAAWALALAWVLGAAPAGAHQGAAPLQFRNGITSLIAGTADQQVQMWDATGAAWGPYTMSTADMSCDDGTDTCTISAAIPRTGTCIGEAADFCPYANGGINFTTTTACATTECDASGEYGRWCPDSDQTDALSLNFCGGATFGWVRLGDVRGLADNTASATAIASTAAETDFSNGTFTVLAGTPAVGTRYVVHAGGVFGATASPTIQMRLRWGTTAGSGPILADILTPTLQTISGRGWQCTFTVTVRTTGTSGTAVSTGQCVFSSSATDGSAIVTVDTTSGTQTINTTAANVAVTLTADWSASSASNTITMETFSVEARR